MKTLLRGHQDFLSCLGLKFPQFQVQKGNFPLRPYSAIDLTNFELRISNYQLKSHDFFRWSLNTPKAETLSYITDPIQKDKKTIVVL